MTRTVSMPLLTSISLALMLVLLSTAARADVAVVVGGDVDKRTAQTLSDALGRGLRDVQEVPQAPRLAARDLDALMQCVTSEGSKECAAQFMGTTLATRAVVFRLVAEGKRSTKVTITGWVLAKAGDTLAVDQRVCEPCSAAELEPAASELLASLLREVKARTSNTVIEVVATPAGSQIEIDGRLVGATKVRHVVYPGPHRIKVHHLGHDSVERQITALEGETRTIDIALKPTQQPKAPPDGGKRPLPPPPRPFPWKPWAVIGAGAVVTGLGVTLWLQDETPSTGEPEPYEYTETTVAGAVTTAVGVGVAGAGVWWLLRERKHQDRTPVVEVNAGGFTIGLAGSF